MKEEEQIDLLQDVLLNHKSNNDIVDLLCIGPLTNIAKWVKNDKLAPLLEHHVNHIWIMGGNIPEEDGEQTISATGVKPEFNFEQDPVAANIVFSSPILASKIFILPEQTCMDVTLSQEGDHVWDQTIQLSKLSSQNGIISRILQKDGSYSQIRYDPLCAFAYMYPSKIKYESMCVSVDPSSGLVVPLKSNDCDINKPIKFITHVDHYGDGGFLSWIHKAVEIEVNVE